MTSKIGWAGVLLAFVFVVLVADTRTALAQPLAQKSGTVGQFTAIELRTASRESHLSGVFRRDLPQMSGRMAGYPFGCQIQRKAACRLYCRELRNAASGS